MSVGTLKMQPAGREERVVILRKFTNAVVPSAPPFRMMGKGLPSRGRGPRLTDRKHCK